MMFVFAINRRVFCEIQRPMFIFCLLFVAVLGGKYDVSSRYSAAGSLPVIILELIGLLRISRRFWHSYALDDYNIVSHSVVIFEFDMISVNLDC